MEKVNGILCPKCKSDNIFADTKGFSLGKAIGGAVLTGGIGAVAGLHGSKNVVLHCVKCGYNFKVGEGVDANTAINDDPINQRISEIAQSSGMLAAVKFAKDAKGISLSEAKKYVESMNIKSAANSSPGCVVMLSVLLIFASILIFL